MGLKTIQKMASTTFGFQNVTRFTTDNSTVQTEIFSGFKILILCIYIAIPIVSLIGNGLVIFVTGYKMKTTVNSIWFLNLAIADFTSSLAVIISAIIDMSKIWHFGNLKCTFLCFVIYINSFTSILLLTTISLDRCLCTWMVVWSRNNRTVFKARIICMIVWVLSISCCIPAIRNHSTAGNNTQQQREGIYNHPKQYYKFLVTYRFIVGFVIPFLIIASSYVAIGVRVKRLNMENQLRSYRVIIAVVLAFFICWLPFHVHKFYYIYAKENQGSESTKEISEAVVTCLGFLNSSLNPILYVFMCEEFKMKLKQSLLLVLETAFAEDHLDFRV
ncbi:C3a anaphylatoxin chemotactic receptor-like [Megalobrama amblycephala]|uniref:C3a anaphylatoxin chemotactic receptor-like n=1 Tax=Megalobrama amblycephala TaxID=75352 RepID=UPI00201464E3|nr:C3a anaphylatoxin chemotactic receptor-like [Megalobrama amblycephala]